MPNIIDPYKFDGLNLRTRYLADPFNGVESSSNVADWGDIRGSYDLLQATAARQPDLGTRTQNSLDVIDFDGVDDFLQGETNSGSILDLPATFFLVMKTDTTSVNQRVFSRYQSGTINGNIEFRVIGSTGTFYLTVRDDTANNIVGVTGTTSPVIISMVADGVNPMELYVNGGTATTTAMAGTFANDSDGRFTFGSRELSAPFHPFNGWIGEFRSYGKALSTAEREGVRDELNSYWAIY